MFGSTNISATRERFSTRTRAGQAAAKLIRPEFSFFPCQRVARLRVVRSWVTVSLDDDLSVFWLRVRCYLCGGRRQQGRRGT